MTGYADLLAKSASRAYPHGEPLTSHLRATLEAAAALRSRIGTISVVPGRFWTWVQLAALLHDAGKAADGCQAMLSGGPSWGQRHEVYSLGFAARLLAGMPTEDLRWIAAGILTHHRPLTGRPGWAVVPTYDDETPSDMAERLGTADEPAATGLLHWLDQAARAAGLLDTPRVPLTAAGLAADAHAMLATVRQAHAEASSQDSDGLTAVLLQGAVTLADHLSSAHGTLQASQPVGRNLAARLTARLELRPHQQHAATVQGHLLLRAPTGSGKTEAALLWAATQAEDMRRTCGGEPRVFYTLPYLASINAMADRLAEDIDPEKIGIAHSRAASYHLAQSLREGASEREAAQAAISRHAATRLFREPVRVGTPYQLLRGALAGPTHSSILADSANSVFILDELHAYDARRFGMILAMAGFWARTGGRVGVMSATLPACVTALLEDTLGTIARVEARHDAWPARHWLHHRTSHLTSDTATAEITARLEAGQAVLAVANRVADAQALHAQLSPIARRLHGDGSAILLHSRFTTADRTAIEQKILSRHKAGQPPAPGLVVATQVVEVSLNVDFDALHTSGAPLEPLLQRFGRVNRLARRPPADVVVHEPRYSTTARNPASERADGVYEAEPTRLAMNILARHDGTAISEGEAAAWLDEAYDSPWGTRWKESVANFRDRFTREFLSFSLPYDDRSSLSESFDDLFDGIDAILARDLDKYREAVNAVTGPVGRLLGTQHLIPLPVHARSSARHDKDLKITIINADYSSETGLGQIRDRSGQPARLDDTP